ncbi:MAG TPA: cupin domain-containing protein, partial [Gaiellaceae bacterium]|nr:cupin domain-containing protein [Gaiellaceae bacterium]
MSERLAEYASRGGDASERLVFGDATILVRVPAQATGGAFALLEEVPPLVDTPLHVHRDEDELFYVLEGEHVYQVGAEEHRVGPGGLVFAPRGLPHSQRRVVPGEGRQLVLVTPGG